MTIHQLSTVQAPPDVRPAVTRRWPLVGGVLFSVAWAAGLSVFSSSTKVRSSGASLIDSYSGHLGAATLQFVLTEGVAGLALGGVVVAIAGARGERRGGPRVSPLIATTGIAAAAVSLVQSLLGIVMVTVLVPAGRAEATQTVSETVNRLDGVKMLLLMVFALAGYIAIRSGHLALPRWLAWVALVLAAAIGVSGVGYLFLLAGPATAAWISLPLLLVYVTGAGIAVGRSGR